MAKEDRVVMAVRKAREEPAMTGCHHQRHLSGGIRRDSRVKEHEYLFLTHQATFSAPANDQGGGAEEL